MDRRRPGSCGRPEATKMGNLGGAKVAAVTGTGGGPGGPGLGHVSGARNRGQGEHQGERVSSVQTAETIGEEDWPSCVCQTPGGRG